ncbi:A-kinase anchor protein 12b [Polymixia lowei]
MGAETSAQRDEKTQEDASAEELSGEVNAIEEGGIAVDSKPLQKNGQISSMTSLNGHSEQNTLAEVGQPDSVSMAQKEEAPEAMDTIQDEVAPQVNGEKVEKESPDANDISAVEEKAAEEKPGEANEVGFKKIFRFVGFKFTLKKDKNEEQDPVKLLTVKDKEGKEAGGADTADDAKEEAATAEEQVTAEEQAGETKADATKDTEGAEATEVPVEDIAAEAVDEEAKEEGAEKESETSPPSQEATQSPFRKLFTGGLFSNLRKKSSIKKSKEGEETEAAAEEEPAETAETAETVETVETAETAEMEETAEAVGEEGEIVEVEQEPKEEPQAMTPEEVKSEATPEVEVAVEVPDPASDTTGEPKPAEEKAEATAEDEKAPTEVTTEAELLSSQEKAKAQGSPLKKLFTGAGLKKLSTKKQKSKKDVEAKLTESGDQAAEQLQSSTESAEGQKPDSGASSPEDSGEHALEVEISTEQSQETEGEVTSDGEKKKEGIIAWSSFKKLVTPKKRVKRASESDDEATGEKPVKSATLSSTESAVFEEKCTEEEAVEDKPTEEEPKTENTEKLMSSTEEPKKKMDTSVSWEALMCMGGPKKRTRRTSDSDDEETKIEEEVVPGEEVQEGKTVESPILTSQEAETEGEVVSSPEPVSNPPEKESAWNTLKRFVLSKNKPKFEEKPEETSDQVLSDSELPKEESSFSLRKLFPGRKKKKVEKQVSAELGSGEEDSDTPAVVPLSEYDVEQVEAKEEEPAVPAVTQMKVSAEDRSPSWIPAIVEDVDDKHDQLSDIPEEAENAATPKSADTTIAEDDIEDHLMPPPGAMDKGRRGRRLSTAEMKPLDPAPAAETTPVPQRPQSETAEMVMEPMVNQVSEIPCQTSVTTEDVPTEVASTETEFEPPVEHATLETKTILKPHAQDEAVAICTGLGTKEIAKVAMEKPVTPIVECMAVISDALCAEVALEERATHIIEEAVAVEDTFFKAQVHQVETTELEPATEDSIIDMPEVETATVGQEPDIEKVAIISAIPDQSEIVQPAEMSENSPKVVMVNPITPTVEATVYTESVEITEPAVAIKEKEVTVEQLAAYEENAPVKEVAQAVTQEITSTLSDTTKNTMIEGTEPAIPEVVPSEEVALAKQTVILVAPFSAELKQMETKEEAVVVKDSSSETRDVLIEAQEIKEVCTVMPVALEDTSAGEVHAEVSAEVTEPTSENINIIQEQSIVITQAIIQNAVDKVSEATPEPKKPTTPTANIPAPVQAVATTEKDMELDTEKPVIRDTPVPAFCEIPVKAPKSPKPVHIAIQVHGTFPLEAIESLDASTGEEKKPEEQLKKALEVKSSEEFVVMEEVVEMNQTGGEPEEVKKEESKEEAVTQEVVTEVKAGADLSEEVKPEAEVTKSETPSEEKKEKTREIRMPVQVVLQVAQVVEDMIMEEEAVVEFDSNGPVEDLAPAKDTGMYPTSPTSQEPLSDSLPTLLEEPPTQASTEAGAPSQDTPVTVAASSTAETEKAAAGKCAEVMAQVIEVIEEAVKEIEPISTEITAAS